jgi:hypothetical protein
MSNQETITIQKNKHHSGIEIKFKNKYKYIVPAYDCFGGNVETTTGTPNYSNIHDNLYEIFQNLNRSTHWLWWELVKNRDRETNLSVIRAESPVIANKISSGYRELNKLNLIKRTKKQTYLLNPSAIVPVFKYYASVLKEWEKLS